MKTTRGLLTSLIAVTTAIGCADKNDGTATGGAAGNGTAGAAGAASVMLEQLTVTNVEKVDLLLMMDNSLAMGDKLALFSEAVPELVRRLVQPLCVDASGAPVGPSTDGACTEGSLEFVPIKDLHVGVVSSSLGGHGGVICSPESAENFNPTQDDRGEMVGLRREGVTGLNAAGFLAWSPGANAEGIAANLAALVTAVGETGCGYEAQLESWYRFLIDPEPPLEVPTVDPATQTIVQPEGRNTVLLQQRTEFLRPDSLLAIVMLSDENDCSIRDDGSSWIIGRLSDRVPRARSVCATDPNDPCCRSCAEAAADAECGAAADDPSCQLGDYKQLEEPLSLRCFEQKRRFGIDFLYPIQRYVDGLTKPTVVTRGGEEVRNPLFSPNPAYPAVLPRTDASLIYLATIVGVPWQDVADEASLSDPQRIVYKRSSELNWELLVGDPAVRDPFMLESIDPRGGAGPLTGPIAPPTAPGGESPVNGHEYENPGQDDLQYACIFPLAESRECTPEFAGGCDCKATSVNSPNRPLCQAPGSTATGITQYYAKAYPGLRMLEVARGFGENSIVASVCPKIPFTGADYAPAFTGYAPAINAILDRMKEPLKVSPCLSRTLPFDADGNLPCEVVEATGEGTGIACDGEYRQEVSPAAASAVRDALLQGGFCGPEAGRDDCSTMTLCALRQTEGTEREACLNDPSPASATGFCYVDPVAGFGNQSLVDDCSGTRGRRLRIVSAPDVTPAIPHRSSVVFLSCPSGT